MIHTFLLIIQLLNHLVCRYANVLFLMYISGFYFILFFALKTYY